MNLRTLLFSTATALALTLPAQAAVLNNLSINVLPDNQVVPQSASAPCIICATTQAHQPIVDGSVFGYNNFNSTGNDVSFNLFSSNTIGTFGNNVQGTFYTGGELRDFLASQGVNLTFGVAVDVNTAGGENGNKETLTQFQLINFGQSGDTPTVIFDLAATAIPNIRNGNGSADYLITGFDLSSVMLGDRLLFRAAWDHATDGGESFYIVPLAAVPIPAPILLFASGLFGLGMLKRFSAKKRVGLDVATA
jgi:hypothetical protein